jgi:hypothetical protein
MRRILIIGGGVFVGIMAALIAIILLLIPRSSDWTHKRTVDAMTDERSATATISNRDSQELQLACTNGGAIRLFLGTGQRMDSYQDESKFAARMVKFRFDDGPVRDTIGFVVDEMVGFDDKGKNWAQPIIAKLPNAKSLAVEAVNYDGDPVQMLFDVSGAEDAIAELKADCDK